MQGTYCTPLQAFKLYIAVKQHFLTKKYNLFKDGVKIRGTQEQLDDRNDKSFFYILSREYLKGDLANYYAANIMAGNTHPSEMQDVVFKEFRSKLYTIKYQFEQDIKILYDFGYGIKPLFRTKSGALPVALQAMHGGHINIETICIIDKLTNGALMKTFDAEITDPLIWKDMRLKISKYTDWININQETLNEINEIFKNYINRGNI